MRVFIEKYDKIENMKSDVFTNTYQNKYYLK